MAVQIPVYVDIQGAFNRAAAEIPKEMPKLEKAISAQALKIQFDGKSLRSWLTDSTLNTKQLQSALGSIRKEFDAVVSGAQKARKGMNVDNLIKSYALLEQRITGTLSQTTVLTMKAEATIGQIQAKIVKLQATLSKAAPGSDLFHKTNYELQLQKQRLAEVSSQLIRYKAGIDATSGSLIKQSTIARQLAGYFSGIYAANTLLRFVKHVRDVTGALEYQRVALGHILQDVEFGNELFEKTVEAAKESPFRITQLVTYTKQLAAYRIEQDKLFETTQRLADISAGLGVDMNRLILAYGQVRAASVLRGQELRQFTEAGIPLVEELAKKFRELGREGTTTADVFQLISERAVPFEMVKEIFEDMTNAGGMFYKMQNEQAKTLRGRWEKLKDTYDKALMAIGETDTFQKWNDSVLNILNGIANNLRVIIKLINAATWAWVAYKVATSAVVKNTVNLTIAMVKQVGLMGTLKAAALALRGAFIKLGAAIKANWVGLTVSAIAGLISLMTSFKKKTSEDAKAVTEMQQAIEKMKRANEDLSYSQTLIKDYDKLSKTVNRTEAQNRQLALSMQELKSLYPELSDKIGDENLSLEDQVRLLGEAAQKKHELAVEDAKERLKTQEQVIRGLENEAEAAEIAKTAYERARQKAEREEEQGYAQVIGRGGGVEIITNAKELANRTIEAGNAASVAAENYDKAAAALSEARKEAERLEALINPQSGKSDLVAWAQEVSDLQEKMAKPGLGPLFDDDDLRKISSVYEFSNKLKKRMTDLQESIKGMRNEYESLPLLKRAGTAGQALMKDIEKSEALFQMAEAIRAMFGFDFSKDKAAEYQKDPFIDLVENRIKYMKDYQRGLENLSQYLKSSEALSETERIMAARGDFLGIGKTARESGGQDLSKWYQDQIDEVVEKMKSKGVKGETAEDILRQKFLGKSNWAKMVRDFQSLLQSLWDAKTDFDTSQMEKQFKQKIEDIKNNLARSSEATNFFRDIFNKTGNEAIATNITATIYGEGFNKSIKDNIMSTLLGARNAANLISDEMLEGDNGDLTKDELQKAVVTAETLKEKIEDLDFTWLLKNINLFPKEWHSAIEQAAKDYENFNKEWLKRAAESYAKFSSIPERKKMVETQSNALLKAIDESDLDDKTKKSLRNAVMTERAQDLSNLELEAIKRGDEWTKTFERLDRVSSDTLRSLIGQLDTWIEKSGPSASPEDLKAVTQARERARAQLIEYNGYEGLIDAAGRYAKALSRQHDLKKEGKQKGREYTDAMNAERDALVDMGLAINTINKNFDEMASAVSSVADILGLEDDSSAKAHFEGIAEAFKMIGSALAIVNAVLALMAMNPLVLSITAVVAGLTAIFTVASSTKVAAANRNIKEQQELLDSLSEAYEHLQDAAEKAFNSDYITNYQSRLANLQAQEAAYLAQAAAEREKGKKADEDQIKQYEKSAREAASAIAEMSEDLQQHFLGTDLTSAARDFASAWIDAYKEFGSTTDAIKEKFRDMITGMVTESLAAQVVQRQLKPIFDYIDGLSGDGVLSVSDAAEVANMTKQAVGSIDLGLTNLMNALSGAGINLRTMGTGLTGISKDIQSASEESILGLAAGVNTQNFYMSQINANVIRIVEMMGGEPRSGQAPGQSDTGAGPTYQDQMLQYARNLPQMASDMAQIRNLLDKVIVKGRDYSVRVS